jgi:HlyD family secretion protein
MTENPTQDSSSRPPDFQYMRDPIVTVCIVFVFLGVVAFGFWASTAQLAQGITASGTLILEDRRRIVQHLEGGIIEALNIREGSTVSAGDVAMVISDATASARFSQASVEQLRLLAAVDRLSAQINQAESLSFPRLNQADVDAQATEEIRISEHRIFADQRAALEGERALIRAGIRLLQREAEALEVRRNGKRREILTLQDEQSIQAGALSQGMGNISRVNELARLMVIAETELLNLDENEGVIERSIQKADLELLQVDLRNRAQLSEVQVEVASELAIVSRELLALGDRIKRSAVIVPVDGVVIDLAYTAANAIVAPGEAVFQLVPNEASYEIEVRFSPQDRDDLAINREVNLRFGTLDPINPPQITGILDQIGADATFDQQSGVFYYLATVTIPLENLEALSDANLSPGIPVEVFFDKGAPRTPLSYFVEPIAEMIRLGMRS